MQRSAHVEVSGIAFVEFSGSRPERLLKLFEQMGFQQMGVSYLRSVTLHAQGDIRFICNPCGGGAAEVFRAVHGRGASAMGFHVADAARAFERALALGAQPAALTDYPLPAIKGVGASLIYFVDEAGLARLMSLFDLPHDARLSVGGVAGRRLVLDAPIMPA